MLNSLKFESKAIHSGLNYQKETGAVIPPIYQSSTFELGNPNNFDYSRSGNPTYKNLEETVAKLENAKYAVSFSSGVAAITAIISQLKAKDTIVAEKNLYGCTFRLLEHVFKKFAINIVYLDLANKKKFTKISKKKPQLIWLESPTNPMLKIIDINSISKIAKNIPIVLDNTFASPYLQKPLKLGATLSLQSLTKYANGHSDALGGAVATNDKFWFEKLLFSQKALGLQPAPFDSWLISRGLKTLKLRMKKHSKNALFICTSLENKFAVNYPFL